MDSTEATKKGISQRVFVLFLVPKRGLGEKTLG
jgi:hypothetical protein